MADKQWKTVALSVAKWVFLILIVLFIFWQVFSRGSESRADFSQVSEAVVSAADLGGMTEGDNQMVRRLYGLDPADYGRSAARCSPLPSAFRSGSAEGIS